MSALPMTARRGLFSLVAATALTGVVLPPMGTADTPISELNRRLYAMAKNRNALDEAYLQAAPEEEEAASAAFDATLRPMLDLHDEFSDHQARTLEDAAIQATIAFYFAEGLHHGNPNADLDRRIVQTLLASIVLCMVDRGGLDIDRLGWGEMRHLCALRAPGGEKAA